jgi:polyisoprenoid-binding protein YceI
MNLKYFAILIAVILITAGIIFYARKESFAQPKFISMQKENSDFEIRKYHPIVVARIKEIGTQNDALSHGFKDLFQYINGNNTVPNNVELKGTKIPMSVPVMQKNIKF